MNKKINNCVRSHKNIDFVYMFAFLKKFLYNSLMMVSADERGGGSGTNSRGPAVRKGTQGPTVLHVFVFLGSIIIC